MFPGDSIDNRLVVYGTLAPGQPNHHVIAPVGGTWLHGTVHGHLRAGGWGFALGFPGLVPDAAAEPVSIRLLVGEALPSHLERLDAFEGADYVRVSIPVEVNGTVIDAWVYALKACAAERKHTSNRG